MSYYFSTETVCYNAFTAAQGITDSLNNFDYAYFCYLLRTEIECARGKSDDCCHAVFDLGPNSDDFFELQSGKFAKLSDRIVYFGEPLTESDLKLVNAHYRDDVVHDALEKARDCFKTYLQGGDKGVVQKPAALLLA